jgi:NAD(P)-dependent dehydrogenase (short-subunit alcohol dehydrogenase family)
MQEKMFSLDGRIAMVFGAGMAGAAHGNGSAIATRLAREGAHVIVVDRDSAASERTCAQIAQAGGQCAAYQADVRHADQVSAAVDFAIREYRQVDVLVNNVGIVTLGGPEELATEDWDNAFAVNVRSAFLACKFALPHMVARRRGVIVNVSSVASMRWSGTPYCAYFASKAALNALSRSVAMQYAGCGIRSNSILLGLIDTPLVREQLAQTDALGVEHLIATRNGMCPTGAMGTPEDAAAAAAFLASDDAHYINGTEIVVDGGLHNQCFAPARSS